MSVRKNNHREAVAQIREFAKVAKDVGENRRILPTVPSGLREQAEGDRLLRKHARALFRMIVGRRPTLEELQEMTG